MKISMPSIPFLMLLHLSLQWSCVLHALPSLYSYTSVISQVQSLPTYTKKSKQTLMYIHLCVLRCSFSSTY